MEIRFLALAASCTSLFLAVFTVFIYSINSDHDLASSYGYAFRFDSMFVTSTIALGAILLAFIVANMILKIKKIPARRYMLVMAAGILVYFGHSWVLGGFWILFTPEQTIDVGLLLVLLLTFGTGALFLIPGIIALKKAGLRIRKRKPDSD